MLELMAAPMAACAILVGIHAYLGMHVIQRKVIFVDLALAQIAALGATFGFLLGFSPHGPWSYSFSLAFAVGGAAIFSLTRIRNERVPQEAIIGIVYAVALALAILVADHAPEGAEHIKETLVGSILWVRWPTILKTALIYVLVGALHIVLRARFLQISFAPVQAYEEGRWVRLWDFIFYVTFAFVITSSVQIAGVLLVFSFLVIPAVVAALFARRVAVRLAIGWCVGFVACLFGLVASYRFDLPAGPSVVSALGLALIVAGLIYYVIGPGHQKSAWLKAMAGVAVVIGLVIGLSVFFASGTFLQISHEHEWETDDRDITLEEQQLRTWVRFTTDCNGERECLAERLQKWHQWAPFMARRVVDEDASIREEAAELLAFIGSSQAMDMLSAAARVEDDPLLRLKEAQALVTADDLRGLEVAVELLEDGTPVLVREEAHVLLVETSGQDFGYDPFQVGEENAAARARWRDWVAAQRRH